MHREHIRVNQSYVNLHLAYPRSYPTSALVSLVAVFFLTVTPAVALGFHVHHHPSRPLSKSTAGLIPPQRFRNRTPFRGFTCQDRTSREEDKSKSHFTHQAPVQNFDAHTKMSSRNSDCVQTDAIQLAVLSQCAEGQLLATEEGNHSGELECEEDPDVVIPDAIARPLLFSSNLMLVPATLALMHAGREHTWPLCAAAICVWITSLLHWKAPRFSSWQRKVDYAAVCLYICVGTWLAIAHAISPGWVAFYFGGLLLIGLIFTANETLFYLQLQRTPTGGRLPVSSAPTDDTLQSKALSLATWAAPPLSGAPARRWAYKRTAWVHLLCVHVLAAVLSSVMLIFGIA